MTARIYTRCWPRAKPSRRTFVGINSSGRGRLSSVRVGWQRPRGPLIVRRNRVASGLPVWLSTIRSAGCCVRGHLIARPKERKHRFKSFASFLRSAGVACGCCDKYSLSECSSVFASCSWTDSRIVATWAARVSKSGERSAKSFAINSFRCSESGSPLMSGARREAIRGRRHPGARLLHARSSPESFVESPPVYEAMPEVG